MQRRIAQKLTLFIALAVVAGCAKPPEYGREFRLSLPGDNRQVWAVAPVINLSGQPGVDPLLQADSLYQQLQTIEGLTIIPVNRVVQVYAAAHIDQVQSPEQAQGVMEVLGCDGLVVGSITLYDPYNPPKFGAAVQLFRRRVVSTGGAPDPRDLVREGMPGLNERLTTTPAFEQAVGMFDAADGSVRDAVLTYAIGRHEPTGPMAAGEYFASMDRYSGFAWNALLEQLLVRMRNGR